MKSSRSKSTKVEKPESERKTAGQFTKGGKTKEELAKIRKEMRSSRKIVRPPPVVEEFDAGRNSEDERMDKKFADMMEANKKEEMAAKLKKEKMLEKLENAKNTEKTEMLPSDKALLKKKKMWKIKK